MTVVLVALGDRILSVVRFEARYGKHKEKGIDWKAMETER